MPIKDNENTINQFRKMSYKFKYTYNNNQIQKSEITHCKIKMSEKKTREKK